MNPPFRCELVTWGRVHGLCRGLAREVRAARFRPDMIVAIGRGGWVPGRVLADLLGLMDLASIKVEHYRGARKSPTALVTQPLAVDVGGRRILVVDDVSDSGDTFHATMAHLYRGAQPAAVRTVTLHHKVVSSFVPDFYGQKIVKWRWIIYPWALAEDLSAFARELQPPPASPAELDRRLAEERGIRVSEASLRDVWTLLLAD